MAGKRGRQPGLPATSTAWKPGQCGNPVGGQRAATIAEWRDALRKILPPERIAEMLTELMASEDESIRLRALDICLDRLYGRPEQSQSVTLDGPAAVKILYRLPDNGRGPSGDGSQGQS